MSVTSKILKSTIKSLYDTVVHIAPYYIGKWVMLKAIEQSAGHWAHGYIPTQQIQAFLSNEAWNLEGPYFKGIAGFIYILHLVHNPDFVDLVDGAEKGVYSLVGGTSNIDDQAELKTSEA